MWNIVNKKSLQIINETTFSKYLFFGSFLLSNKYYKNHTKTACENIYSINCLRANPF